MVVFALDALLVVDLVVVVGEMVVGPKCMDLFR